MFIMIDYVFMIFFRIYNIPINYHIINSIIKLFKTFFNIMLLEQDKQINVLVFVLLRHLTN